MLSIPGALKVGAIVARDNLVAKNARWYVASADGIEKVGWGDLAVNDLELIGAEIGPRAFVAVTEVPAGFGSVSSDRWT